METIENFLLALKGYFSVPLFTLGKGVVTPLTVINLLVLTGLLLYLTGRLRKWIVDKLLAMTRMEVGARQATGSIIRYFVLVVGFVIVLQTAGIDFTALNVLAGAIGIGVGLGLQDVVNNFICGLIILFERPIKVGDRIVVGDVEGDVMHIGARSVAVVTNDNITIIVPNSKFITENVINWSHSERKVRFIIPVPVAYGSDVRLVERLLLEVAANDKDVLENPPPAVRLMGFGDSELRFELRAWTTSLIQKKGLLTSNLNFAILDAFLANGISIPFPQRDLHLHRHRDSRPTEDLPPYRT